MSLDHGGFSSPGLWQLVESDAYRVDIPFWEELAVDSGGGVLDLGCGIGRVSHQLNQMGQTTTGADRNAALVEDFNRTRPAGSPLALTADVTRLRGTDSPIHGRYFDLVIAPQQLLQIIGGPKARMSLFKALSLLTSSDGLVAFAICEGLPEDPVDYPDVAPDILELDGWVHSSQPVSIETTTEEVTAIRVRRSLSPSGEVIEQHHAVTLDRLDLPGLEDELIEAGLTPVRSAHIPATDRHMDSTLVIARPSSP